MTPLVLHGYNSLQAAVEIEKLSSPFVLLI